jgi:hypothetical protein
VVTELNTTGVAPAGMAVALMVKTCWCSITLVACRGETAIDASTHVLTAGPLFPDVPSVVRWNVTPPTVVSADAGTVVAPAVGEVTWTEQRPVLPLVWQLWTPLTKLAEAPSELTNEKLIVVPLAAGARVLLLLTSTSAVRV